MTGQLTIPGERRSLTHAALTRYGFDHERECRTCKDLAEGIRNDPCPELALILDIAAGYESDDALRAKPRLDIRSPRTFGDRLRAFLCRHDDQASLHTGPVVGTAKCKRCGTITRVELPLLNRNLLPADWTQHIRENRFA